MGKKEIGLKSKLHHLIDKHDSKGHKKKIDNFFEIIHDLKIKNSANILEIGAGNGVFSNFMAVYFNAHVISSDPYGGEGAPTENHAINSSIVRELGYDRVQVTKKDFLNFQTKEKFDYIFAINVIHHIVETKKELSDDFENHQKCIAVFKKIFDILDNGGIFLMRDVEKENWQRFFGLKTSTNFKLKQNNWEWTRVLREVGFEISKMRYLTPRVIRNIPLSHFIFNNRFVSLFFDSAYVIVAKKK